MEAQKSTLFYVYDPMCAWCWGYKPVWNKIQSALGDVVSIVDVLGGLAPETDQPMPQAQREAIASYWRKIENLLGTEFNHDFWSENIPRRSTYPACRAALVARQQGRERAMTEAIQHAYYLEAKNPSDDDVLLQLARDIGLDRENFEQAYYSSEIKQQLAEEIDFARSIGGNSFPSLFLKQGQQIMEFPIDYKDEAVTISQIRQAIASLSQPR